MTQPTDTPPAAGQTGMAGSEHANDANSGPVAGNRTPMMIGLIGVGLVAGLMVLAILTRLIRF